MKVLLHDETELTLTDFDVPGFEVESTAEGEHLHFSALPMFITSLGLCTASVLASYGENLGASLEDLEIRLKWDYTDEPVYRVDNIVMVVRWPSLPESRLQAVQRVAARCPIHGTLHHPAQILTIVRGAAMEVSGAV